MNHLGDFIATRWYFVTAAVLFGIAAVVLELRHRLQGAAALSPAQAVRVINSGALVLDVRDAESFAAGHIIDARNIASNDIAGQADGLKKFREKPVLLYCDSGGVSATAARLMKSLGFGKVVNLQGGLAAWKQEN